jgi:5-methyltetrahydrofolate--homocysteine methyltransferase
MSEIVKEIYDNVVDGQSTVVQQKVTQALQAGEDPAVILNDGMIAAMAEVGQRFEAGDFFVPEMLIAARAMQSGMALLKPHLALADIKIAGKVVIGTVKGDLHDIGKNLVAMMLEGAGFEIRDLGTDVTPEKFVGEAQGSGAQIVAMSALLTTTMPNMKTTVEALKAAGIRDTVKVLIGGAPVTDAYAQQIGADGYAADASRAVAVAKSLVA